MSTHGIRLVCLFLLAGTGCLSPVALLLTGSLIFRGKGLGIDLKTAPPLVRALTWITFSLSGFLTLLMVILLAVK